MLHTLADALRRAENRLGAQGSTRSDAEELVGRLLGLGRNDLYFERSRVVSEDEWDRLEDWVARRALGEPVQYITGRAAFRNLDLAVDRRVLIPRPETEGLVEAVLEVLRSESARWHEPRVLDLGTGSGAIALAIAQETPGARVTAVDASEAALEVARENARACGLAHRVTFLEGDWWSALSPDDRFEAIVSNPPYVSPAERDELPADVRDHEPHEALFSDEGGLAALRAIVDEAPRHIVASGLMALELSERRAGEVAAWIEGAHDWADVTLRNDLSGRPRVLLARRERGPAIAPQQWAGE